MKRSLMLIGGAAGAVALLGGITYAAYAVNDNANPFGTKITPGSLTDETVKKITLEWGNNTIAPVSGLTSGSTQKVGELSLKASGMDEEEYTGILKLDLSDLTDYGEKAPDAYLYDYLTIDVYKGSLETKPETNDERIGGIAAGATNHSSSISVTGNAEGAIYSIFVTLDESVTPYYETVKTQSVYLSFDWNKSGNDEEASTNPVYLYNESNVWDGDIYVYAWNGSKQNATFPGEAMNKVADKFYSFDLLKDYTNIIFSAKKDGEVAYQTVDLKYDSSKPYATIDEKASDNEKYTVTWGADKPTILADYYITGVIEGVNRWYSSVGLLQEYAMSEPDDATQNLAQFNGLSLKAGDSIKAISSSNDSQYYGVSGSDSNYECSEDGAYDVYLSKDEHIYVVKSSS